MTPVHTVVWTRSAVEDLEEILEFLVSEAGAEAAHRTYEEIRTAISSLAEMPQRCLRVPELREIPSLEHRELLSGHYRIIFRIDGPTVILLGVLDARRDLEELLIQRATLRTGRP